MLGINHSDNKKAMKIKKVPYQYRYDEVLRCQYLTPCPVGREVMVGSDDCARCKRFVGVWLKENLVECLSKEPDFEQLELFA